MKLNASRIKKQWQALALFVVLDFFCLSSERVVLSVVVVYVWCFLGVAIASRGRALFTSGWRHHFRLSRDVDRSHQAIAPSIAGPCRPSLTCLLFQHWECFSWPLPKPARLCKVSAFRRVGIRAIKSLQKKIGKEQWKRNEELWKRQLKVLRLASVDLERSEKT